jgi:hypothetical protein
MLGQPRHGVRVYQAVRVEQDEARPAIGPVENVLADQRFEKF